MKASAAEMKAEALERMEMLKIAKETIDMFRDKGWLGQSLPPHGTCVIDREPVLASEHIKEHVKEFEKKNNALVYHVIETDYEDGNIYAFLFVCDNRDHWAEGRADLKAGTPKVYIYNEYDSLACQIGEIAIKHSTGSYGGLVRTV